MSNMNHHHVISRRLNLWANRSNRAGKNRKARETYLLPTCWLSSHSGTPRNAAMTNIQGSPDHHVWRLGPKLRKYRSCGFQSKPDARSDPQPKPETPIEAIATHMAQPAVLADEPLAQPRRAGDATALPPELQARGRRVPKPTNAQTGGRAEWAGGGMAVPGSRSPKGPGEPLCTMTPCICACLVCLLIYGLSEFRPDCNKCRRHDAEGPKWVNNRPHWQGRMPAAPGLNNGVDRLTI